jgi:dTDP-glucose 4,6-dehydratase
VAAAKAIWKNRRVLVTGGGGFIGSHLVERLVGMGATVRAMVHYNALGTHGWLDHSAYQSDMEIFTGDICDRDSVRAAMRDIQTVFHLAALIAIPYSYQAPISYVNTNIHGTLNVLQAGREEGVERIIHTSTSEVYGTAQSIPISESHPLQGQSPYSASKIGADKLVEAFFHSFKLPIITVRPFNTFGPRQSARAVIPTIVSQLLVGNTVRLGNLEPKRDLNFVDNTVDGYMAAATHPDVFGKTFNLGSGREISIGDLVALIAQFIDKPVEIVSESQRKRPTGSEVERLLADFSLAKNLLNWTPLISLEEGLKKTIPWIEQNSGKFRPEMYTV